MGIATAIAGALVLVALVAVAIWLLRRPTYRYRGSSEPRERRSFRETMTVWLMGPRN